MRNYAQLERYKVLNDCKRHPQRTKIEVSEPFHLEIKYLSEVKGRVIVKK